MTQNITNEDLRLEFKKDEEFAYGFIIEVITGGLYPNKFHVIREYIQNSFDAICKWRKDPDFDSMGDIKIKISGNSIIIFDTGTGMDRDKINQYRYIGYSEKKLGESTGFRGIGKLSGISVAEKLIVTSSEFGTKERYKLVFDARAMVLEILNLKSRGENIPLNELIKKHTEIITEEEDEKLHYTIVELHNIRNDSKMLLEESKLIEFLGMNVPVGFDPVFEFGEEIDEKIKEIIDDYETVSINVGDEEVYKPYISPCKRPQYEFVWDETEDIEEQNLIAFCWYCQNIESRQFEDKEKSGLVFKYKNFTIGDRFLTREKLWASTPERAFWFFGEVLVNDKNIIPTSERNNFVQNDAREKLFKKGKQISKTLSKIVGKFSEEKRAVLKIEESENIIKQIEKDYEAGNISKDIQLDKVVSVFKAIEEIEKRLNKAPTESHKQKGRRIIKKGKRLLKKIEKPVVKEGEKEKIYDITEDLGFDEQAKIVYNTIINSIKDEFVDDKEFCEKLIQKIHKALREKLNKNE